jgi:micrococcal nuclease
MVRIITFHERLETLIHHKGLMQIKTLPISLLLLSFMLNINSQDNKRQKEYYQVKKVVDGDTFWVDDGSEKGIKVRLIGVDAPESRKSGSKEITMFGRESSDYLTRLIGGKKVRLLYDVGHFDRYGRTLAYVYLEDGTFVNAKLVKEGYANVMTVPPNVKYADTFLNLERKARNQKRGMWGAKAPK